MPTLAEFKGNLLGGGARANQFRVELTFPSFVAAGTLAGAKAQFLCRSASLPASTVNPIPVPFRGKQVKVAGERQYSDWSVQIYNDTDFLIRNAFEQWSNGIANHTQVGGLVTPAQYQSDMTVNQLDRNGLVLKSYKIVNAWPVNIGEIQLDYAQDGQIEEFPVQFTFDYWIALDGTTT
jgi:hypothetical protein